MLFHVLFDPWTERRQTMHQRYVTQFYSCEIEISVLNNQWLMPVTRLGALLAILSAIYLGSRIADEYFEIGFEFVQTERDNSYWLKSSNRTGRAIRIMSIAESEGCGCLTTAVELPSVATVGGQTWMKIIASEAFTLRPGGVTVIYEDSGSILQKRL